MPQTGPLPGAYAKADLPELERRLAAGDYSLRGVNPRVVQVDPRLLADVDTPDDLRATYESTSPLSTSSGPEPVFDREPAVAGDHVRDPLDAVDGDAAAAEEVARAEILVEGVQAALPPRVVAQVELRQQVGEDRLAVSLARR